MSSMSRSLLTVIFAVICCQSVSFVPLNSNTIRRTSSIIFPPSPVIPQTSRTSKTQVGLFQGFFGGGDKKNKKNENENLTAPSAGKVSDEKKLKEMKSNLAKIGNTQKRDYEAEAKARAPPPKVLQDKQTLSFNFNKPNEFPNLFKGTHFIFFFY